MTRWLGYIILLTGGVPAAHGTSCARLRPCEYVRPNSVIFIGTVESVEPLPRADRLRMGLTHRVTLKAKEIFAGVPAQTSEIAVVSWNLAEGKDYLIDGFRDADGKVTSTICGHTQQVDESDEYLRYLRLRQKGQAPTSLTVAVYGATRMSSIGIADAEVVVHGPQGELRGATDAQGKVAFEGIAPGKYTIAASRPNYRVDEQLVQQDKVTVMDQACPSGYVYLRTDSFVSGVLRMPDGTGVSGFELDLIGINPERERRGFDGGTYGTMTGESGEFRFDGVLPGRYVLGNGLMFPAIVTSRAPVSYYPGRKSRAEALEILVMPGASIEGLQYTLINTGAPRTIRVRVVDENGRPAAGAHIQDRSWERERRADYSILGEGLEAGGDGWLEVQGFEDARYVVGAYLPGRTMLESRDSQAVQIAPGRRAVTVQLVIGPPPKPRSKRSTAP